MCARVVLGRVKDPAQDNAGSFLSHYLCLVAKHADGVDLRQGQTLFVPVSFGSDSIMLAAGNYL